MGEEGEILGDDGEIGPFSFSYGRHFSFRDFHLPSSNMLLFVLGTGEIDGKKCDCMGMSRAKSATLVASFTYISDVKPERTSQVLTCQSAMSGTSSSCGQSCVG